MDRTQKFYVIGVVLGMTIGAFLATVITHVVMT